jgi:hypothetical protein
MNRYASVLWMPPGASRFCSRQAWGRRVAYATQFANPDNRAHIGKAKIKSRLIANAGGNAGSKAAQFLILAGEFQIFSDDLLAKRPAQRRKLNALSKSRCIPSLNLRGEPVKSDKWPSKIRHK